MTEPKPSPDDAFQRAAEELWTPVFRFALALTNDLSEADDVAQEAFVRLWSRRATIDWGEPVLGWLLVTARRIALDRFRRLARALRLGTAPAAPAGIDAATVERFVDLRSELARLTSTERPRSCFRPSRAGQPMRSGLRSASPPVRFGRRRAAAGRS